MMERGAEDGRMRASARAGRPRPFSLLSSTITVRLLITVADRELCYEHAVGGH